MRMVPGARPAVPGPGAAAGAVRAAVTVLALVVAGCGGQSGPELGVADLQQQQYFYEGRDLGQRFVVRARVAEVHSPDHFELADAESSARLPVVARHPVHVVAGEPVRVVATVGQLRHWTPSEQLPYIQDDLYSKRQTETYLYDADVLPAAR